MFCQEMIKSSIDKTDLLEKALQLNRGTRTFITTNCTILLYFKAKPEKISVGESA